MLILSYSLTVKPEEIPLHCSCTGHLKQKEQGYTVRKKKYLLEHTSEYRPQGGKIHQRLKIKGSVNQRAFL